MDQPGLQEKANSDVPDELVHVSDETRGKGPAESPPAVPLIRKRKTVQNLASASEM